jgi:PAS domain S-box-containing protein
MGAVPMTTSAKIGKWVSGRQWRLYVLFFLLVGLPISFFAYSVGKLLTDQTETEAATESAQIGRISSSLVREHFRQSAAFLESIASRRTIAPAWQTGDLQLIEWHLKDASSLRPDFAFLGMFDLDGTMRATYPPLPEKLNQNLASRDWYKGVTREWKPYVSEVYQTAILPHSLVVAVAVPVKDNLGKPIAILVGAFTLRAMTESLPQSRLEGAWAISLVDQNGHLSARKNIDSDFSPVDLSEYEPVRLIRNGRTGSGTYIRDGTSFFAHYEPLPQFGWGILVEQRSSALHQGVRTVEERVWLLALLFLVLGLALSLFMSSVYSELETGNHFVNLSADMFCASGFDGFIKSINPACQKTLGFTPQEMMSRPYTEFMHPYDRQATIDEISRIQTSGVTSFAFENRLVCRDGSYKWLSWNAFSDSKQKLTYAVARDITGRKRVEDALRESEELLGLMIDSVRDYAIFRLDSSGNVTTWNQGAERIKGYRAEEILGRHFSCFYTQEDRDGGKPARELQIAIAEGRYEEEGWRVRKDGSTFWANVIITALIDRAGTLRGFSKVTRDVSERKRATELLKENNKELDLRNREVERATKLKSKFLATMSHELRTPLNAIVGFSDLLGDGTAGELNEKQKRFVNHIKQGSAHLLQLINDILDLSKIEAGQLEFHLQDIVVADALPEVLSTIRPLAMAKNIQVEHGDDNLAIYADRVRFKQILYNLLSNAVKFTPPEGRIQIDCFSEREQIFISIRDTGVGIPLEEQQAIFEEFRQAETKKGDHPEGTGLGLTITKRLVEGQGGTISVQSAPGKGSCFTFSLPAGFAKKPAESPAVEVNIPEAVPQSANKPLVLIVDDEPSARELLSSYLGDNYRVAMADSGASAIRKVKELQPDAITLDVLMSGGSGFETLVTLRHTPETQHIPIIIVSIVDQKNMGFALGATDYIIKPIRKSVLLDCVRRYVPSRVDDDSAVLLVDDDPKTLELLEETLRSVGYEVQSVQCGSRALEVLSSKLVGAVLLDLLMPGMDGFEVIRHIREQPTLRDLPIFVMTAKTLTAEELRLLNRDTQALFQKSGSWHQQLLREMQRVLHQRQRANAAGRS